MELAFSTKMLRDICESEILAHQIFGFDVAKTLIARLADLRAVDIVTHLPVSNPERIIHNSMECMKIELANNVPLILCANHIKNPMLSEVMVDWDKVRRIKVCSIGDYSG